MNGLDKAYSFCIENFQDVYHPSEITSLNCILLCVSTSGFRLLPLLANGKFSYASFCNFAVVGMRAYPVSMPFQFSPKIWINIKDVLLRNA